MITRVLRIGRRCPEASDDILEIMLLVSQIQAYVGIDHGYKHARRVIARLRHPLWDDLTPEERAVLNQAAAAIKRACHLDEDELAQDEVAAEQEASLTRETVHEAIEAAMGDELTPDQVSRTAGVVMALLDWRMR